MPGSKRDAINKELEVIQRWALLNNLKLNPNKSKEMLFSSSGDELELSFSFRLYLGLISSYLVRTTY